MLDAATGLSIANVLMILGIIFKLFILPWYQTKKAAAAESENPGPNIETQKLTANNIRIPGITKICLEHKTQVTKVCTRLKGIEDGIERIEKTNEKDHDQIWERLNEIRDKI